MAEVKIQEGESIESALAPLQAQGSARGHHQGHQEALLLPEAGRQAPGQAGAGAQAQPQEAAARGGVALSTASGGTA